MKSIKAFVLFLFLSTTPVFASYIKPTPNNVEIAGEWLYMLPSIDQGFLVSIFLSGSKRNFAYKQEWQSGYRIEAIYNFCQCLNDIRFRWSQFPSFSLSKNAEAASGSIEIALPGTNPLISQTPTTVFTKAKFDFYYLDALIGQRLICFPRFTLGVHGGIQYMHFDLEENYIIFDPSFYIATWTGRMWGIGPEVDVEWGYSIGKCFRITGRGFASLLINDKISKRVGVDRGE
ncbi:MAG: Lpg1974 family pore-forming outer membrane protein, partial [Chlamydiales bacterium]